MRLIAILITLTLGLVQQQLPAGTITGVVVDDATGVPLSNARITLSASQSASGREVVSDDEGTYRFESLRPGAYQLRIAREGYLWTVNRLFPDSQGVTFQNVTVEAGRVHNVPIRLERASIIAGRLYGEDGQPVRNAFVELMTVDYRSGQPTLIPASNVRPVTTDDEGMYRFESLGPDAYFIRAAKQVEQAREFLTYYHGVYNADEAAAIPINTGTDIQTLDFTLRSSSSFRVTGKIINALSNTDRPVYQYYLVPRDARVRAQERTRSNRTATPNEFEIGDVQPGAYYLYIAYPKLIQGSLATDIYSGRASVDIVDRDVSDLVVQIDSGVDIPGQVLLETSPGRARPNIQGLYPLLMSVDGMPGIFSPTALLGRGQFVQPDGTFVLRHAASGRYRLIMVLDGTSTLYVASARLGTEDILGRAFEVSTDTTGPLILEVRDDGGRFQGRVTYRDEPLGGAGVMLIPPIDFREDQQAYRSVAADQDGRFSISGIRPGTYTVFAATQRLDVPDLMNPQFVTPYLRRGTVMEIGKSQILTQDLQVLQ